MQIVIDKESLVKNFALALYILLGGSYENAKNTVEELIEAVEYEEFSNMIDDLR